MPRPRITKESYDRLSAQEREEMVTPATYLAKRPVGEKKWRIFMQVRDNGRIIETECGPKGYLSKEKADKDVQKFQDKENASVEKTKSQFAFFEKLNKAASANSASTAAVLEINQNKCIGYHPCKDEDEAVEVFQKIVSEYGVEAYEEMIGEKIFEDDNGYTVQIVSTKTSETSETSETSTTPKVTSKPYNDMKAIADEALELAEAYSGKESERVKELAVMFEKLP